MKKIPFLILLAFCFTGLLGGIFCAVPAYRSHTKLAQAEAASTSVTFSSGNDIQDYVRTYSAQNANDDLKLSSPGGGSTVIDMQGITLNYTIGNDVSPFCGTFDGQGLTIKNLTIDLSSAPSSSTIYAGLFGRLGRDSVTENSAIIKDVTFEDVTIIAPNADVIYAGIIAYGEDCEISNVKVSGQTATQGVSVQTGESNKSYVGGIAGFFDGAKIDGVQISSDVKFELSKSISTNVGTLVGQSKNSSINNVQVSSNNLDKKLSVNLTGKKNGETFASDETFASNVVFGGLVGYADNSSLTNVICRINSFGNWNFSRNDGKIHSLGGVVGAMESSSIVFGIFSSTVSAEIEDSFEGRINLGGVVGKIFGTNNILVNVGMKNNFNLTNSPTNSFCVGEIAGIIADPSQKISYVHFKENSGIALFGDQGEFLFQDPQNSDFVSSSGQLDLENLQMTNGRCPYFSQQVWNTFYGDWDFDNTWYFSAQNIYLQNFYVGFSVTVSSVDERALQFEGINGQSGKTSITNVPYGQETKLRFSFKNDGEVRMSDFYELSNLKYNGSEVGRFLSSEDGYRLSGNDAYSVKMVDDQEGEVVFDVIIKKMTRATSGSYSITISPKRFSVTVRTRLYEKSKDGDQEDETWNEKVPAPGSLQADNGPLRDVLPLTNVVYGASYKIRTQAKPANSEGEIFAPTKEWYLVKNGEEGEVLKRIPDEYVQDGILLLEFGKGDFLGDLEIFAKYTSNSCTGIFTLSEGVQKIELSSGAITVENSGDQRPISKDDPKLRMDIYILKGYEFDKESFIDKLGYKSSVDGKVFCKFLKEEENVDSTCFQFEIDMTSLNWDDVNINNIFSVEVKTTKIETKDNSWIWWVVGGVGGAIVLAAVIVLIVWLVRRNRFGGGGKMKTSKKSYKGMYY